MNYVLFILWLLLTVLLCLSIIGLFVIAPVTHGYGDFKHPSTWMLIGKDLLNECKE